MKKAFLRRYQEIGQGFLDRFFCLEGGVVFGRRYNE